MFGFMHVLLNFQRIINKSYEEEKVFIEKVILHTLPETPPV